MDITTTQITQIAARDIVNNDGQIAGVPSNPRTISRDKFAQLKERIEKNNLLGVFPLKVYAQDGKYITLGGNQRLRAAKALHYKQIPCIIIPQDTDISTLQEIVILENSHDGENDWEKLANEWDANDLKDWGVDAGNWGNEQQLSDCTEISAGTFADKVKLTFEFTTEEHAFIRQRLGENMEQQLLEILGYEA